MTGWLRRPLLLLVTALITNVVTVALLPHLVMRAVVLGMGRVARGLVMVRRVVEDEAQFAAVDQARRQGDWRAVAHGSPAPAGGG